MIDPFKHFFPIGISYLLLGILIWLPQIWNPGDYPVLVHRYLVINGFTASFIAGFLMTAIPKFSQTFEARKEEMSSFILITLIGLFFAYIQDERIVFLCSTLQGIILLYFIFRRILQRKANPPYTFVFIFVALGLWITSGLMGIFSEDENIKILLYEGSITSLILGVGSRLIPAILGHSDIVLKQRKRYEKPVSLFSTLPIPFLFIVVLFVLSYLLEDIYGNYIRASVVFIIGIFFWKLWQWPKTRSALSISLWFCSWLIVSSFFLKAFWTEAPIHALHSFFINGIVLLNFLIATRVIVSHTGQDKELENSKWLYFISGMIIFAAATRVTAYLMPDHYLSHLGYSSFILSIAIVTWSLKYLKFVFKIKIS
ncbi:MAG: NnrS family protein [Bacteriovoracaceae bacterium]